MDHLGVQNKGSGAVSSTFAAVWLLRHGKSLANLEGIIASTPDTALLRHGLCAEGERQVLEVPLPFGADAEVLVLSSDYLRAAQTARLLAGRLPRSTCRLDAGLRERDFGPLDGLGHDLYAEVWKHDARKVAMEGVESPPRVLERALASLEEAAALVRSERLRSGEQSSGGFRCEKGASGGESPGKPVLVVVAHGDVLQILLAHGQGLEPWRHREVPHIGTAEFRELWLPGEGGSA